MIAAQKRRVALVTGGSRGIGRAACLSLAEQGAVIAVHYRAQAAAADEVVKIIESRAGRAIAIQGDLAEADAPARLINQTVQQLGAIDILVNNAGEMTHSSVAEMSDEIWEQTLTVNLTAAFRLTRACIPAMLERHWGRIINVASQVVYTGSVNHAHYAAAKAGLIGFTYSLAKELGAAGITVNAVCPGRIVTDMISEQLPIRQAEWLAQTPLKRFGEPEEVAAAIAFLASDGASYITGAVLNVNGGLVMG